jgi:hypothetical protein
LLEPIGSDRDEDLVSALIGNHPIDCGDPRVIAIIRAMKEFLIGDSRLRGAFDLAWWCPNEFEAIVWALRNVYLCLENLNLFHTKTGILSKPTAAASHSRDSCSACVANDRREMC